MSHWNYRVTRERFPDEDQYAIREVYYDGDKIVGWTSDPSAPIGENLQELIEALERMRTVATDADLQIIDVSDDTHPFLIDGD